LAHRDLRSFPTRRSSDLCIDSSGSWDWACAEPAKTPVKANDANIAAEQIRSNMGSLYRRFCFARRDQLACATTIGAEVTTGEPRSEEHTSELQSRFDLVC